MRPLWSTTTRLTQAALGLAILLAAPASAGEIYDDSWVKARSPAFLVYSTLGAEGTAETAQELEDFGQLVATLTTIGGTSPRVPTQVFIFKGADASVGLARDVGGRFMPTMRGNFATARQRSGLGLSRVLQHEYAHFLLHNNNSLAYPRWFDEGFAELASTATLKNGKFTFGNVDANRATWLKRGNWVSYSSLLDPARNIEFNRVQTAMFYAQSWALVHYLMLGPKGKEFPARMSEYLRLVQAGEPDVAAFEQAFDERADKLGRTIRDYLQKMMMLSGTLKKPLPRAGVTVTPATADEIAARLGTIALYLGRREDSEAYYRSALTRNPVNGEALVGVADHLKFSGKYAEAEPLYRKAIERWPDNDNYHLDFGEYWLDRAEAAEEPAEVTSFLRLARQQLAAAFKLNDSNPETLAVYGSSFLMGDSDPAKGLDTLQLASQLLPADPSIKWELARLYVALHRPDDARPLLQALIAWSHGGRAPQAEELLARIDGRTYTPPTASAEEGEPETGEEPEGRD